MAHLSYLRGATPTVMRKSGRIVSIKFFGVCGDCGVDSLDVAARAHDRLVLRSLAAQLGTLASMLRVRCRR